MGVLGRLLGVIPDPPRGPLADLADRAPYAATTPLDEVELLALDLETTGLDARKDELLSFGHVTVVEREIRLGTMRHLPVRPRGEVGESATIHGLTDDRLAKAPPSEEVLGEVLSAFHAPDGRRRVLVAHFSPIETGFLADLCRRVHGATVGLQVIDTLDVEIALLRAHPAEIAAGTLRLDACRRRYHLPRYRAHNAAIDALACAELLLAQWAELEHRRRRPVLLSDVARTRLVS